MTQKLESNESNLPKEEIKIPESEPIEALNNEIEDKEIPNIESNEILGKEVESMDTKEIEMTSEPEISSVKRKSSESDALPPKIEAVKRLRAAFRFHRFLKFVVNSILSAKK